LPKDKKLPALQFYPGDWRKALDVQSLSFHDRGVWFEMLMIMHDSERRGVLVLNGVAMTEEMIARAIGLDNQTFNQTLTTLLTIGVASREEGTGAIMCRRMVRDENIRKIRAEAGSKGGNPVLLNQKSTTTDKQKSTPSSSSSLKDLRPDDVLEAWNLNRGPLSEVMKLSGKRRDKILLRLKEGMTVDLFRKAVSIAATTPFLTGKSVRGWKCDFDFLIENDTNLFKVLEGKYGKPTSSSQEENPDMLAFIRARKAAILAEAQR
jgi:hypothetical protein